MALPDSFWLTVTIVIGAIVGSFIAAASIRIPAKRPIAWDRSACDSCQRQLSPLELIPIFSFVALRGRCGSCGSKIAWRHVWFEAAGLMIGVWATLVQPGSSALVSAALGWQLLLLAALDAEHLWLPRALTICVIVSGLLAAAGVGMDALLPRAIGAMAGFAVLWTLAFLYRKMRKREGLGGGDAWLLAGSGAWVGWAGLPLVVLIASLGGLAFALAPLAFGRRLQSDRPLPLGVFLAIGTWLVWLCRPA